MSPHKFVEQIATRREGKKKEGGGGRKEEKEKGKRAEMLSKGGEKEDNTSKLFPRRYALSHSDRSSLRD